ncbi:MAG: carbohydrate kinase family protein [Gaiellaceae bacterium]
MSRVTVFGYVNLEHVVGLSRDVERGVTSLVERRHTPPEGRVGGCASYIATGLAEAGLSVDIASFVGEDDEAELVARSLVAAGVGVEALERGPQPHTGSVWLPYGPSDASYCIYDPGGPLPETLTERQRRVCAGAAWLVASVGPPGPCAETLDALPPTASLFWSVKADPGSLPPSLTRALAARAGVIVFSSVEAEFLEQSLGVDWRDHVASPDALIVETRGPLGLRYWTSGQEHQIEPGLRLEILDTIGAGDRFCAGLLAALIGGADTAAAVTNGAETAATLLRRRLDVDAGRRDAVVRPRV